MTKENQRRLYDHYVSVAKDGKDISRGQGRITEKEMGARNVRMMLEAYPEFAKNNSKEETNISAVKGKGGK